MQSLSRSPSVVSHRVVHDRRRSRCPGRRTAPELPGKLLVLSVSSQSVSATGSHRRRPSPSPSRQSSAGSRGSVIVGQHTRFHRRCRLSHHYPDRRRIGAQSMTVDLVAIAQEVSSSESPLSTHAVTVVVDDRRTGPALPGKFACCPCRHSRYRRHRHASVSKPSPSASPQSSAGFRGSRSSSRELPSHRPRRRLSHRPPAYGSSCRRLNVSSQSLIGDRRRYRPGSPRSGSQSLSWPSHSSGVTREHRVAGSVSSQSVPPQAPSVSKPSPSPSMTVVDRIQTGR